jgi:hypothetical protein
MWDSPVHRQAIVNESRLLTRMNILGILSIIVELSVSFAGTKLNIFTVDIVLKIEDCLVEGGHAICRVVLYLVNFGDITYVSSYLIAFVCL